jgi:hypothetical protein
MIFGYYPYIRDIFRGHTRPHPYTWLIWAITQGTATAILFYGGGMYSGIGLLIGTALILFVAILSFIRGTSNITRSDTITLVIALFAIVVWWQLKNPYLAVLIVALTDGFGYFPTFRKTWQDPHSETPIFWFATFTSTIAMLIANAEYNFLTMFYLSVLAFCNITVWGICVWRGRIIKVKESS